LGIARGLAAAHRRRIVHRDLKPENVFVVDDCTVKILDFGVAKLQDTRERDSNGDGTLNGFIAGTAGYMAPEQVRGEEVDARADLFALGAMLYEMLAGAAPFKRGSVVETLHAVLAVDPTDIADVNRRVPGELAQIVRRLLQKDREARFHSAADLVWALEQVSGGGPRPRKHQAEGASSAANSPMRHRVPVWIAAAATLGIVTAAAVRIATRASAPPISEAITRFSWTLPAGVELGSPPAVSPDGRSVAFVGVRDGVSHLFIRSLGARDARKIDGTEVARQPFWSPDSQWIGFFARRRLMKVSIHGGVPVTIADDSSAVSARTERGAAWGLGDVIVYGAGFNPPALFSVPASGGAPTPTTTLGLEPPENQHRFPWFLPDGRHFVYQARGTTELGGLFLGCIDHETPRELLGGVDSNAMYVPSAARDQGVLVYAADGRLTAHRFDPVRRILVGTPQQLGIEVGRETIFAAPTFGVSSNLLAYAGQISYGRQIKTLREGADAPLVVLDRDDQQWPRISPDGTRMAWLPIDKLQGADIWVEDLARRTRTRVTTAPERDLTHVWSPDGRLLAYRPDVEDNKRVSIIAADGSGAFRDLICPRVRCEPTDWSSDGRELLVNAYEPGNTDVWMLSVADGGRTRPLLESRFKERDARLSPNRRWLAYVTDEAGKPEVSVRSLDESARRRYTVSPAGGDQVVWGRNGRALYYVDPKGRLQKVPVHEGSGELLFGTPTELPVTIGSGHANTQYDIASDGRIFYLDPTPMPAPTEIHFVLGWQDLLRR
jgi:eukaryotic-like serine/threonine-protein kinase